MWDDKCRVIKIASMLFLIQFLASCSHQTTRCQSDWKITGFYTPIAKDFNQKLEQKIKIRKYRTVSFNKKFIAAVKLEGWGKTRFGWFLGYYGGEWHKENAPLNSLGYPLEIGAVAVDKKIINKNVKIRIPAIQEIVGINQFIAVDVGAAIKNQHIDVYTGEGKAAKERAFQITGNHQVCFTRQSGAPVTDVSASD